MPSIRNMLNLARPRTGDIPAQRQAEVPDRGAAAWQRLEEGNRRWAVGHSSAEAARGPERRAALVDGQHPFAMVLGCADSRLPTEILFDQGLGDLFVVRTAGHALDEAVLGSIEYAVAALGVDLVVVLGHQSCGAIKAAAHTLDDGTVPDGHIRGLVERLAPDMARGRQAGITDLDDLSRWHASATVDLLRQRSNIVRDASEAKGLGLVAATYELGTGLVKRADQKPAGSSS